MPDIFIDPTPTIKTKGNTVLKPVREATPLLLGKIIFALLIPIILYILVVFSAVEIRHLFSFDDDWSIEFLLFLVALTLIQTLLVTIVTLLWRSHEYYLTDNYIQENKGIFTRSDKVYDLKNVRDISVRQDIFGRLWNYGDIVVESTAPGYRELLTLSGIPNPQEHEAFLKKFI